MSNPSPPAPSATNVCKEGGKSSACNKSSNGSSKNGLAGGGGFTCVFRGRPCDHTFCGWPGRPNAI